MDLITKEYKTIRAVSGPLIMVERVKDAGLGEMCEVRLSDDETRLGQIIEIRGDLAVVQVLEGTQGIGLASTSVVFTGEPLRVGLSRDMLGRTFNGIGEPIDGLPCIIAEDYRDMNGLPMNPCAREKPDLFIETGISAIDGLNTLVRGQKLPIFTLSGLPSNELALQIVRQARVQTGEEFSVVLGAMGITSREAFMFSEGLKDAGALSRTVSFINLAGDPIIEKLFTPRIALTVAEYLAFEKGHHVMVVLTDMASYCDALRVIGGAREEIPGRRGYPGYMYTDLAGIYERAGRIKGSGGSITIMPIVTMPDDDITHPIPDLTGYITEGQIVLSRTLERRSVYPPIDCLPSLSRLMNLGIGKGKTKERHRELADQLYASFARAVDVRRVMAIVGEEGMTELDRSYLKFADGFEKTFVGQGKVHRSIDDTLSTGWELLGLLPERELTRIR